jgi:hypothetical protein
MDITCPLGLAEGTVYDQDNGVGENYVNGRLAIVVTMTLNRLRDVDDPTYDFTVSLQNTRSGWGTSFSLDNMENGPASGSSGTIVFTGTSDWTYTDGTVGNANLRATLPIDSEHRWVYGTLTMELDNLYWNPSWDNLDNVAWKDGDNINITISGRDTMVFPESSGAYLVGYPEG